MSEHKRILHHMWRHRWTAFLLVAMAYILSFFHRVAPATIADDLQQAFQTTGAELGLLAATYFYVYTVMQIPTGILVDTLGPRRIVVVGGLIGGLGAILFGLAPSFDMAAVGRTLVGLGVSVMFIALLKINAAWFYERHFATATGLTVLLGNVGAVLAAVPLAWLVALMSWRDIFVGIGLFSLLLALLSWHLIHDHPKSAGLPSMRQLEGKDDHQPHLGHWLEGLRRVAGNRASWPGFWVNVGMAGSFFSFAGLWAVPFLTQGFGMSRELASWHTTVLLLAFAFGALFSGMLSDRLARRKPVLLVLALVYCLCWGLLLAGWEMAPPSSLLLFGLMGAGAAGFTLSWSCAKEVNSPALSGMATSLVNTGAFLSAGILQPMVGWLLDRAASMRGATASGTYVLADYRLGLSAMLGFALLGLLAATRVRETHGRNLNA